MGQICCVLPGLGDDAGDVAHVCVVRSDDAGIGAVDEEVCGVGGGVVDEVQVGHWHVGQDFTS